MDHKAKSDQSGQGKTKDGEQAPKAPAQEPSKQTQTPKPDPK